MPPSFQKFFARTLKVPNSQIGSKEWVLKLITAIFVEKIFADEEASVKGENKQPLSEFVYEFFIQLYGFRSLAEQVDICQVRTFRTNIASCSIYTTSSAASNIMLDPLTS
jgi:hypothetical protein